MLVPYCDDPLPNVLIELRDASGKFTDTKTDSRGQFKFGNLSEGTYTFKTTLDGFPSVFGTVVLQKHAKKSEAIRIELPLMPLPSANSRLSRTRKLESMWTNTAFTRSCEESVPTETVVGNLRLASPTFVPGEHQAN